ncbi:MAG: hypothetical protein HWN79_16345 [Candidatus Lokiarchaeota archaeon]|nr:hypothetical protein [Candidatus Lokiarchaeota archaeon]
MIRKLNDLEYLNFSLGQPYNIVIVLRVNCAISTDELKKVLRKAQKKHPFLKVRIQADDKDIFWFTSKGVKEIPIEHAEYISDDQTNIFFLKNLETNFNIKDLNLPLFRITLITSLEHTDIILCAQHTISDGLSMVLLTRDLIDFLNNPDIDVESLDTPLKKDDIFSPKIRKRIPNKAFLTKAFFSLLRIYYFLKFGKKKKENLHDTDYIKDDLRLILWNLSIDETDLFIQLCKQNKVSVHSAISSLFLPEFSTINNPVNLRNRLNYPIGEAFGLYASGAVVKMKYKENQDFWVNANHYQSKLLHSLRDKNIYKIHKMVHIGVPIELLKELSPIFLEIASNQEAFGITNLGSLDRMGIEFDSNKFSVESFYGALSFPIGAITVLVFTMKGQLHFNLHYLESHHDAQRIEKIVENTKNRIRDLLAEMK